MKVDNQCDFSIIEGQKTHKNVIDISWDGLLSNPPSSSNISTSRIEQSEEKGSFLNALAELQRTILFEEQVHDIYLSDQEISGQKLKSQNSSKLGINQNFLKNNVEKFILDFQDKESENRRIYYGIVQCCECQKFNLVDLLEDGYYVSRQSLTEQLLKPKMIKTPNKKYPLNSPKNCKKLSSSKTQTSTPTTPRNFSKKSRQKDEHHKPKQLKNKHLKQKKKYYRVENEYFKKKEKKQKKN